NLKNILKSVLGQDRRIFNNYYYYKPNFRQESLYFSELSRGLKRSLALALYKIAVYERIIYYLSLLENLLSFSLR
ncbi:hypothetical protein N7507_001984, partial [Penicillium longicatenatum]